MRILLRAAVIVAAVALAVADPGAQSPATLTVDSIYHPERRVNFSGAPVADLVWLDASTYLSRRQAGGGTEWLKVDVATGRSSPLFDAARMEAALASLPGVTQTEASLTARSGDLDFN